MSTESYLNIYRIYVYRIHSQIIDKWGVAQNAGQDTSGMWIKYGSSDACADRFRQPNYNTWTMTGFPKSGWLSCCSIAYTSRNRKEYFTIIVKTWGELTSLRLLA